MHFEYKNGKMAYIQKVKDYVISILKKKKLCNKNTLWTNLDRLYCTERKSDLIKCQWQYPQNS